MKSKQQQNPIDRIPAVRLAVFSTGVLAAILVTVAAFRPFESIGPPTTLTPSDAAATEQVSAAAPNTAPATITAPATTTVPTTTVSTAPTTTVPTTNAVDVTMGLWAAGDIGDCYSDAPAQVAELIRQRPGPLIALGDIAYPSGTLDQFDNCFAQPFTNIINRTIPVVGNHEYETPNAQGWKEFFNQDDTYYSQALTPDWLLIVVDSECNLIGGCGPDDPQQQWLTQTLATAPKCVIVATHRPYRTSQVDYDRQPRAEHIHNITTSHNADIFLTGHAHIYEHINHGTTQQFTIGTGGAGLRGIGDRVPGSTSALSEHGALHMTLTATGYSWEFLNTDGTPLHSGANTCS